MLHSCVNRSQSNNSDSKDFTFTKLREQEELSLPSVRLLFSYGCCRAELDDVGVARKFLLQVSR